MMNLVRRRSFLLVLLAFAPATFAAPAPAETRWTMATEYPASAMPGEGIATFARLAGEKSAGRLVVSPSFDAASGLRSATIPGAVRDGRIEAGDAFAGSIASIDPIFALPSLPFLTPSFDEARRLADLVRPAYEAAARRMDQKLLYLTPWPPTGLWSKRAVRTPADLAGLPVRTYDATSSRVLAGAGADAIEISFADTMPRLKDGSIQAVLSSGDGGAGRKLWEFLPNFTEISYAIPLSVATVSLKAYGALPEQDRAIVDAAAAETEAKLWTLVRERLAANYARMGQNGVALEVAPDATLLAGLRRAAAPEIAAWKTSAGPDGAALLDRFLAAAPR